MRPYLTQEKLAPFKALTANMASDLSHSPAPRPPVRARTFQTGVVTDGKQGGLLMANVAYVRALRSSYRVRPVGGGIKPGARPLPLFISRIQ